MKRFFKITGLLLLILLVIIAGGIGYIVATVNLDDIKHRISDEVKKQTGRELTIVGDLGLSFFPWIGIEIGETRLGNAAGFQGDFLSFKEARASIRLIPLFSRNVEMSKLLLDGFSLKLTQRKDGVNNWDDLAARGQKQAPAAAPKEEKPSTAAAPLGAFLLDGVEIRNAQLRYEDRRSGAGVELARLNLVTDQVGLKRDVPFTVSFDLNLEEPKVQGSYGLKGVANIDPAGLYRVRDLEFTAAVTAAQQPVDTIEATLTSNVGFDQKAMRLTADPLELRTKLSGTTLPDKPTRIDLKTSLTVDLQATSARLRPLQLEMPGSTMNGEASFAQKGEKQQLDFNFAFDQIDLARLVAPAPQGSEPDKPKTQGAKSASADKQGVRNLLVNGDITIGRLIREKLLVTDIAMRIKMDDGVLRVAPFTAKLYGGLASQDIRVDLRPEAPVVNAKTEVKGFQVGDYLAAAMEKDMLSGNADVQADVRLTAADADAIKKSLNGTAAFTVRDGALKGVNIPDMIRRAKAALAGETIPASSLQQTDFTELSGSAVITDGIVQNDDLAMKSPLLRITGKGKAELPAERVDYLVTAKLVASIKGQGGEELKDLVGLPIPIRIQGSFSQPEWKFDLASVLEEKAKAEVKGVIDEALKDPEKALKDPKKLLEEPKKSLEGLKNIFK